MQGAANSEDAFRQFVANREKIDILHNPAFGLYSQPRETRTAFVERCSEETNRRLEQEAERLESTFRRRIDQIKERSDREEREQGNEQAPGEERVQDVNVAWGQTLYNITSGRPAAVAEAPQSMREIDFMEKIAQIQRSWDRELQTMRDELTAKAGEIEEISVVPSPKQIEIRKYVILWAGKLP